MTAKNTEPFALKDRIDPSKDIDERELIRTVNTINDIEDKPKRFLEPGRSDTGAAFQQIKSYQHSRGLKPDGIVRPKGPTEKRIAAEQHTLQTGGRPTIGHGRAKKVAIVPVRSGVGAGQRNRPRDLSLTEKALTLAGHAAGKSAPASKAPGVGRSAFAENGLMAFQKAQGLQTDGIMKPDGPTHALLNTIVAPQINHLAGTNPNAPKPARKDPPAIVARVLKDRPTTVRTFEQDPRTQPTTAEYSSAVGLLKSEAEKAKKTATDRIAGSQGDDRISGGSADDLIDDLKETAADNYRLPTAIEALLIDAIEGRATEQTIKPYTPSPSERRSFYLRKNLGRTTGGGVNDLLDWIDPATPLADFVHRRVQKKEYNLEDMLVLISLSAGAGTATSKLGSPLVKKAQKQLLDNLDKGRHYHGEDGSIDLGHVADDIVSTDRNTYASAPIRMRIGEPGLGGFGARHISPDKHSRAQALGYPNGLALIEDVARHHDVIIEQADNGRLMFVLGDDHMKYAIAEYHPAKGWRRLLGDKGEYSVTTGFPDDTKNVGKPQRTVGSRAIRKGGENHLAQRISDFMADSYHQTPPDETAFLQPSQFLSSGKWPQRAD